MRRTKECREEGCTDAPLRGAFFCEKHVSLKRQCQGNVQIVDPDNGVILESRRCKKPARPGLLVCASHGGGGPKMTEVSHRTAALTAMQRFVEPYRGDLDPVTAFEAEFRRTYGRILWLEEQIGALEEEDLIWGQTREEVISATEFAGTNRVYEARIHTYEEMLRWERKHLLDMEKVWIGAKLDERKISVMRSQIDYTYGLCVKLARALGHDPTDPETRTIIGRLFEHELALEEGRSALEQGEGGEAG